MNSLELFTKDNEKDINEIIEKSFKNGQLSDDIEDLNKLVKNVVRAEKEIKRIKENVMEKLKEAMSENNIMRIDTLDYTINFIDGTDRETFDKKRFQEEHEELYNKYIKFSKVKPSIRVNLK